MKKRTLLNICMILTVILIAVCGVMAVGSVKGWFGNGSESDITVAEKVGIAMIERNGVAYEVSTGTALRADDKLYTKNASTLTLAKADKSFIYLEKSSEIKVADVNSFSFEVQSGEAFVDARVSENISVKSGETQISMSNAVATVSTQAGSTMVYVYAGEATVQNASEEPTVVNAGKVISLVKDSDNAISDLIANSLNDFEIAKLVACGMDETFCFTESQLKEVQQEREAEILKAQQEALKAKEDAKKNEVQPESETVIETPTEDEVTEDIDLETEGSIPEEEYYEEEYYEEDEEIVVPESTEKYCTIEIRCDTILDNMDNLTSGKEGYVPSNGTIFGTTQVTFEDGETVFDVLQRVCTNAGIQLEYSYTPLYESYYIEGMNHLYEFDCGEQSGWMYKVNGWFPNYGCSSYYLEDGDVIVWCYTCNGLGADVGGSNY